MSRTRRLYAPNELHHLISRIVNREFRIAGHEERTEYLRRAETALRRMDGGPLGFALMSNHTHWAFLAGERPLSQFQIGRAHV